MCIENGEFGLIERIKERFSELVPKDIEGIGDDCCVIDNCGSKVITTDMLIEDVHFRRSMPPMDLGRRAVEVNLSDVASMGATPMAMLLSIALPDWVDQNWCNQFIDGIAQRGVPLIGGDTTRSQSGLVINITAIGRVEPQNIKRRSAAQVGDRVMVTGELGASAASNYTAPVRAQIDEGIWLGGRAEVGAMMDLSDGLAGDLPHILKLSGVGAQIELSKIPVATTATLDQALGGGEDYKLLLTVRADAAERLQTDFVQKFGTPLYDIGAMTSGNSITWTQQGAPTKIKNSGFRHF